MRIGIVCYPTFGGSGVLATELGKALADKGHQVHFITYQQPVRLSEFHANIFYHEVRVAAYPLFDYPPYETALSSTMVDVIVNNDIDLLHVTDHVDEVVDIIARAAEQRAELDTYGTEDQW